MRPRFITKSSLLLLACAACVSQAHAAGDAAATSSYLTIQPNATNTAYVYTFSWVARDTDNAGGGATGVSPVYTDTGLTQGYGNGTAALDNVTNLGGGDYIFDNTANGGDAATKIYYYGSALGVSGDSHIRYETNPVNTATRVNYQDPLDTTIGGTAPTAATPRFDTIGNFATDSMNIISVGSGVQGVTGVFSTNPNGTGAATGQGVGFYIDTDGTDDATGTDDFGPLLVGYDTILNPNKTNPMPNTGYVQVVVPYPTTGVVSDAFTESFNVGTYTRNAAVEVFVTTDSSYVPKIALAGDMDSDFDIDNADIGVVTGNFTGSVAAGGKFYATGDLTADGDVDNVDIGIVTGGFTGSLAGNLTPTVGVPDLKYNPSTGNITVDTEGLAITSFQLENYATGTFNSANYNSPENSSANLFGFTYEQVSGNVIGDSDGSNIGFTGLHDFGNILPTGFTQQQLEAYLQTAFWGTLGAGSGEFDLVVIPEPGAALLGGLSLLTLLRRRRN